MPTWNDHLQRNQSGYLRELLELLRIPSVSTDPAHNADVHRAAEWVSMRLRAAGMENVQVLPTGPHACVYGDWLHAPGKPTLLIYGHFDVQPADPLELWDSPPFEPTVRDGRVYARGAADMKANLLLSIAAVEALLAAGGRLPVNIKFLFEGQEEIGSRDLYALVASRRDLLACDVCLTPDSIQWGDEQPAMFMGTKGMCALQIDLETAGMDLHSGLYGGAVPNAAHTLVELLGSLRDGAGNILVEGFYDQVAPLTPAEREAFSKVPFDADRFKSGIGVESLIGEPGYTPYEQMWARPTLDVNGIWGGYSGEGVKTIIPARAHAKITCRLVADQDPERIVDCLEAHLMSHAPASAKIAFQRSTIGARPYLVPLDLPEAKIVAEVLEEIYGRAPYFVRIGGSLPITAMFLEELGAYTIPVGFGQEDERVHSPNEFMRLSDFEKGMHVYARLIERFGES